MSQKNEHSGIESYFQSVQALLRRVIESQRPLLERTSGLAGPLLDRYQPQPGEMIFIFSNSGVNQMPVETACRLRGGGRGTASV